MISINSDVCRSFCESICESDDATPWRSTGVVQVRTLHRAYSRFFAFKHIAVLLLREPAGEVMTFNHNNTDWNYCRPSGRQGDPPGVRSRIETAQVLETIAT